jgi:hypothetical protein
MAQAGYFPSAARSASRTPSEALRGREGAAFSRRSAGGWDRARTTWTSGSRSGSASVKTTAGIPEGASTAACMEALAFSSSSWRTCSASAAPSQVQELGASRLLHRPAQADGSGLGGRQLCGRSSSIRGKGWICTCMSTSAMYSTGLTPSTSHVAMSEWSAARFSPAASCPTNRKFLRPRAQSCLG